MSGGLSMIGNKIEFECARSSRMPSREVNELE
jgi:hypothetical protein